MSHTVSNAFNQVSQFVKPYLTKMQPLAKPLIGTTGIGLAGAGVYVLVKELPMIRNILSTVGKATSAAVSKPSSQQVWRTVVRSSAAIASIVAGALIVNRQLPFNRIGSSTRA